jgi:hypothetical protein
MIMLFDIPVPSRMSSNKLSLGRINLYITSLFPPRESLVSDIPAGEGNIVKLFYGVATSTLGEREEARHASKNWEGIVQCA